MKTKALIFLGVVAISTLSFTFINIKESSKEQIITVSSPKATTEPLGGFASDKILK